jgi:four helix bundle protein
MRDFRDIKAWHKAHALVLRIYEASAGLPVEERYGLTSQMRRAAVSISANIAEGTGRDGDADLRRFLLIATGSASEVEYLVLLAHDLGVIPQDRQQALQNDIEEVKRMLSAFIIKLTANR